MAWIQGNNYNSHKGLTDSKALIYIKLYTNPWSYFGQVYIWIYKSFNWTHLNVSLLNPCWLIQPLYSSQYRLGDEKVERYISRQNNHKYILSNNGNGVQQYVYLNLHVEIKIIRFLKISLFYLEWELWNITHTLDISTNKIQQT